MEPTEMALAARSASRALQSISSEERAAALHRVADALVANEAEILKENLADLADAEKNKVEPALLARLKLKDGKIAQLAQGVRSLADMEEPIGRCLRHTQVHTQVRTNVHHARFRVRCCYRVIQSLHLVRKKAALSCVGTSKTPNFEENPACGAHTLTLFESECARFIKSNKCIVFITV
eukprot:1196037-Prorocentrum_minimum.AAC.4